MKLNLIKKNNNIFPFDLLNTVKCVPEYASEKHKEVFALN